MVIEIAAFDQELQKLLGLGWRSIELGDVVKGRRYRISDGTSEYFCRAVVSSDVTKIELENAVILALSGSNVDHCDPSSIILGDLDTNLAIRPWIEGAVSAGFTPIDGNIIGRTLSLMHRLEGFDRSVLPVWRYANLHDLSHEKWHLMNEAFSASGDRRVIGVFQAVCDIIEHKLHLIRDYTVETGLVHGDMKGSNIVRIGLRRCVIDWEFSGLGCRLIDLSLTNLHYLYGSDRGEPHRNILTDAYFGEKCDFPLSALRHATEIAGFGYFVQDLAWLFRAKFVGSSDDFEKRLRYMINWCLPQYRRFYCDTIRGGGIIFRDLCPDIIEGYFTGY